MKTVYAITNYECDLSCQHCQLHTRHIEFNPIQFYQQLNILAKSNSIVILFGGEPTLSYDRLMNCIKTRAVKTISTNLLNTSDDAIQQIIKNDIEISTSWNFSRFNQTQYQKWLQNLQKLKQHKCMVLITLTKDLIEDDNYPRVLSVLSDIEQTEGCDKVLFEHLIDTASDSEHNSKCDDWLCRLHHDWRFDMQNVIEERVKTGWKFECDDVWTLQPDGRLDFGCPHALDSHHSSCHIGCLTCMNAGKCQPCRLQHACTYPHKLFSLLRNTCTGIS